MAETGIVEASSIDH